jgi:hypothetical protein
VVRPPRPAAAAAPRTTRRHAGGPRRARKRPRRIRPPAVAGVVALLVLAVGVAFVLLRGNGGGSRDGAVAAPVSADPATAVVGSCVKGNSDNDLVVVACDQPGATDRVVAKVAGTRALFDADKDAELPFCSSAPETESAYYTGPDTGAGAILCLVPLTPNR